MTEVKKSSSGNLGLFSSKSFQAGDVILEETPAIVLSSSSEAKKEKDSKPSGKVKPPSTVELQFHGTFRSMVEAGLCWMKQQTKEDADKNAILDLYFPSTEASSSHEKKVIGVAKEAVKYLKKNKPDFNDWDTVEKVMLIWACNSFMGGRIYLKISRVNHDCNPNAVIKADGDTQRLVAATDIANGEEVRISYLGSILYADTQSRNARLQQTKFFECKCDRCSLQDDMAARIPCPACHPRQARQSLDEDVQYDDDQTVQYVTSSSSCSKCKFTLEKCSKLSKSMATVTSKIVAYLETQETTSGANEAANDDDEILEEHVSLASTIMGARHWTTNLMLLLHLDRRLSGMSSVMLTKQEMPEMEEVAEAIDSLQRVCRFVDSLQLKLHSGHILGDVIIGVARTLVSLGDVKSQKYGAEWLDKIQDYVDKFESEGRQKVVSALSVAWKKHDSDGCDGCEPKKKKTKT